MKQLLALIAVAAIVLIIFYSVGYLENKKEQKNTYSQKFEYKESEVSKLKRELDNIRLEKMRIQAKLDSCKYFTQPCPEITKPRSKGRPKIKTYKIEYDSTLQLLNQKRLDCADLEIKLTDEINFKKRQLDTCSYFVQEFDKALLKQTDELTKLNNERDSLKNILNTSITVTKEFPCLKAKRGTVVVASVVPLTGEKDFTISNFKLPKDKYKAIKKQCKKVRSR